MEILGLVIIVFLLALGMFYMLQISTGKDPIGNSPQQFKLAQDTIDAMKSIKVDCPPNKRVGFDELVQDMASNNDIYCDYKPSYLYAEQISRTILNKTLMNWSKSFMFTIEYEDNDLIQPIVHNNCTDISNGDTGIQPLPVPGGGSTVAIKLKICT